MVDLLELLGPALTTERRCGVWKSVFALLQLFVSKNQDAGPIAGKLYASFAAVSRYQK